MILPKMVSLTIFLVLPAFLLVNGQTSVTPAPTSAVATSAPLTPAVSPSSGSFLQQICLNVEEYRSMFTSILSDNSIFSRDIIARVITWVDWFYNTYNRYKWVIDFALGAMTTLSVFLPGGPLIPIISKVVISIAMDSNMRRLIKEITYEVWTMIPPSGSEQYNVAMENSMVIVRQIAAPTAKLFKRSVENTNWSAIIGSLSQRLADLQRDVLANKPF
ncbi:uncharacterized protein LOC107360258 [Tetranychus urticae]|uniref:Uncharacterized protein n=1 Tax=Tetranychus urticae TaxID=32264 RepID=T1K5Z3_TETUR|nr:uncharacterized protein LOC107360258 [Tetranychus urticae]